MRYLYIPDAFNSSVLESVAWHRIVWYGVVSDWTVRSKTRLEFSKSMLRRIACEGVKSESIDDGVQQILRGKRSGKVLTSITSADTISGYVCVCMRVSV